MKLNTHCVVVHCLLCLLFSWTSSMIHSFMSCSEQVWGSLQRQQRSSITVLPFNTVRVFDPSEWKSGWVCSLWERAIYFGYCLVWLCCVGSSRAGGIFHWQREERGRGRERGRWEVKIGARRVGSGRRRSKRKVDEEQTAPVMIHCCVTAQKSPNKDERHTSLVLAMRRYWYWSFRSLVSSSFSLRMLTATGPNFSSVPK